MNAVTRPDRLLWVVFIALGFMWGSSYLFIKVGVDNGLPPFTLIAMRLFFGFLVIATVVLLAREPLPRSRRQYGHLLVMANVNIVLPFFLPDERITLNRLAGLAIGFVGVLVLFLPDLAVLEGNSLLGWFALLGSAVAYAIGNVYAKRNVKGLRPMIPALFQVGFALAITTLLALVLEQPIGRVAVTPQALFAVVWLGILGSGFAYLAYFRLLKDWGATRTSLVAYLLPVFGIALGALAGEPITLSRIVGTALIIGGGATVEPPRAARPRFV